MTDAQASKKMIYLNRDCIARMVPQGAQIMLREGTEVRLLQDKGNAYTVDVYGNLARIDGVDADALGLEPKDALADIKEEATLEEKVEHMLDQVYDPEIPVSIKALGLIYETKVIEDKNDPGCFSVYIDMTLTAPGCGMGPVIVEDVKQKLLKIPEITHVEVELIFDPPWDRNMMSEEAKLQLGLF